MRTRRPLAAIVVALLVLLAACGNSSDDATPATPPEGAADDAAPTTSEEDEDGGDDEEDEEDEPPAPEGSEPGPYPVGRQTEQVTDASRDDRTLTVEVWYPAETEDPATPHELIPGLGFEADLSTVDAAPSTDGPFPLVVFSHGSGGLRQQSASILETIVSHGFVVVAADHIGNTAIDRLLGSQTPPDVTARNRVLDVRLLVDEIEAGRLADGLADADRLAVMGHSAGGFTALATAAGYDDIEPDARVDAIVPLAPASSRLSDEALGSIEIPMLIVTGSADETTPVEDNSTRPLELASGPATLVEIDGGSHEVVTNICDIVEAVSAPDAPVPEGTVEAAEALAGSTCQPDAPVTVQEAFDATEHHVVAFLRFHLADDDRYADIEPAAGVTVRS
jgi:predicted dienelactone hydrolase